jgi:hypothetical protein
MRFSFVTLFPCLCSTFYLGAGAQAQSIGFIGTLGGSISSVETYNSAGGNNSLVFVGNTVAVTLPGLGNGLNSNVQVNATNTNGRGHYCNVINWGTSNGVDVVVNVACFDLSNSPILADFALFYQARTTPPIGAGIAYVWADQPTAPSYTPNPNYSFNSIGGPNSITRSSTGNYTVILGDFGSNDSNAQVTAYGNVAARCQLTGWKQSFDDGAHVGVHCVNTTGAAADELFSLSFARGGIAGSGKLAGGFAWANKPARKNYRPDKTEQFSNISQAQFMTAHRIGGKVQGDYSLSVPNPGNLDFPQFISMVTSIGTNGEYCDTDGIFLEPPDLNLGIVCYDFVGRSINTQYSATLMVEP